MPSAYTCRSVQERRTESENQPHALADEYDHANCDEGRAGDGYSHQMINDMKIVNTSLGEILI
jgi:hypothetical protein